MHNCRKKWNYKRQHTRSCRASFKKKTMRCSASSSLWRGKPKGFKWCLMKFSKEMHNCKKTTNNWKWCREKWNMFSKTSRRKIQNYEYFTDVKDKKNLNWGRETRTGENMYRNAEWNPSNGEQKNPICMDCIRNSSTQTLKCKRSDNRRKYMKTSSVLFKNCRGDIKSCWPSTTKFNKQRNNIMHEEKKVQEEKYKELQEEN